MKNRGKKWSIANTIVQVIVAAGSLISIVTSMKAAKYDEEQEYKKLEDRYGLEPIDSLEDED